MRPSLRPAILATTALIGLGAFATILPALAAPPAPAAAASPMPVAATQSSGIEDRINDLHTSLAITAAEQPQWDAFAQVMRDNATAMDQAFQARIAALDTMTAPQNLQSYQNIAMAHAQGMQKLVPAFQALYDSMPADQQKVADQVFHDQPHGAASKGG
jgi:hypothetical protein